MAESTPPAGVTVTGLGRLMSWPSSTVHEYVNALDPALELVPVQCDDGKVRRGIPDGDVPEVRSRLETDRAHKRSEAAGWQPGPRGPK